ncbi:hypothetical protein [Wolbachia pipientis]|nr:hypothetical protein [Wolbachia pipientis]
MNRGMTVRGGMDVGKPFLGQLYRLSSLASFKVIGCYLRKYSHNLSNITE